MQNPRAAGARVKIDAKGFFSTERTFLHWARVAMLLVFTGCTMAINALDNSQFWFSQVQGIGIGMVGLLFGAYAYFKYQRRMVGYNTGRTMSIKDFQDVRGPVVLALLQTLGLLVTIGMAIINANADKEYYIGPVKGNTTLAAVPAEATSALDPPPFFSVAAVPGQEP